MKDTRKTKFQLIEELEELRARAAQLEEAAAETQDAAALRRAVEDLQAELMHHKQTEKALRESERELSIRTRISNVFLTVPADQMYAEVLAVVLEALDSKHGVFGYVDENGGMVCPSLTHDVWDECEVLDKTYVFPREKWGGLWGRALREKRSLFSNGSLHVPEGHVPVIKALAVPILYHGEAIGLFVVGNKATDYTIEDQQLLERIADRVAPILHARLEQDRLEKRRRQAEKEIADLKEFYASILESIVTGVWVTDENDIVRYINKGMEAIAGMTAEQLVGLPALAEGPDTTQEQHLYVSAKQTLRPHQYDAIPVTIPSGRLTYRSGWVIPQVRDGRFAGMIVTVEDVTERKRAEKALREAYDELEARVADRTAELARANEELRIEIGERRRAEQALRESGNSYRTLAENLPGIVYRIHLHDGNRLEFFNDMLYALTGYTEEELAFDELCALHSLILPEDRKAVVSVIHRAVESGAPFELEYRLERKDGDVAHVFERGGVHQVSDARLTHIDGIILDITERQRSQAALLEASRIEATATLAGGVAHDLNNLMVGVLGNAGLLRVDFEANSEALEMLDEISHAARRAGELAQQMLAFARGGKYDPHVLNLNDIINETVSLQERSAPPRVRIERRLHPELWNTRCDATQMNQVIMNLCINAVEAIEASGHIMVTTRNFVADEEFVASNSGFEPGPYVCLSVEDTGCGMSPDVLSKVFEPFFSTKYQGRGLGLAAVYGIVKNHGGQIWIKSQEGKGAKVTVFLPAEMGEEEEPPAPESLLPQGTETIMVIDDEQHVLDTVPKMLRTLGYKVLTAQDGKQAVEIARDYDGEIHLALLDIEMPVMDGPEAYPLLMAARPSLRVMVCSGYGLDTGTQNMLDAGASAFLQKPFTLAALAAELRKALDA